MAIFHCHVSTVSRAKGQSSIASICYRSGTRIFDQRLGISFDYRRRLRAIESSMIFGWQGTREMLWNAAERAEKRGNATVAREVQVAIPKELSRVGGQRLVNTFSQWVAERFGVTVDASIHRAAKESANRHAHLLFTTRRLKNGHDFGEKTREWDELGKNGRGKGTVLEVRTKWAELANAELARGGSSERIDHRTLAEQGADREPISLSRGALAAKRAGRSTPQNDEMAARQRRNRITAGTRSARRSVDPPLSSVISVDDELEPSYGATDHFYEGQSLGEDAVVTKTRNDQKGRRQPRL